MNERQRQDFKQWFDKRGVWPRLTYEEIFEAGIQAALAQREPVKAATGDDLAIYQSMADNYKCESVTEEVKRYELSLAQVGNGAEMLHSYKGGWVKFTDWQRTEAARLAAERKAAQEEDAANAMRKHYAAMKYRAEAAEIERDVLRADHTQLANDLVAALAECKVKQETILALQSHDDKEQRHQAYLTLRGYDEKGHRG